MPSLRSWRSHVAGSMSCGLLLVSILLVSSCKSGQKADADQADQMAMWLNSVPQLKTLDVSNAEIGELTIAHQAGLTDPSTVVLIKLARDHKQPFTDGHSIANLLNAGASEQTVLELARINQLGIWAGEAQALRLAGISDKIILAVAERRSKGLPVLSGGKLGELKNSGASDATILEMVQRGASEKTASEYIAQRNAAAGGHNFVFQGHRKRS